MRFLAMTIAGAALMLATGPADAQLATGTRAPDFKTMGAIGGTEFRLHLAEQLEKGPVVLYFFPKAFTSGCTLESKAFADAMPQFRKAGATVIGLSGDDVDTLARFSTEVCRSKVPMAHASAELMEAYDAKLPAVGVAMRTSYVIDTDGTISLVHSDMDYKDHVATTLRAVKKLAGAGG